MMSEMKQICCGAGKRNEGPTQETKENPAPQSLVRALNLPVAGQAKTCPVSLGSSNQASL